MAIWENSRKLLPESVKKALRPIKNLFTNKYEEEMVWWRKSHIKEYGKFSNIHYERLMLAMAEETNSDFLKNMIVADFGCGPRGSLVWAQSASIRIGIDVLADRYADEFPEDIISHGMIYVKSTENLVPLPSDIIDVLYTLNAIDHVDNFPKMCSELIRVLKPGGLFIGGFNLEEPASPCEPQQLDEEIIKTHLLDDLEILSYRITNKGPKDNGYAPFFEGNLIYTPGNEGYLWVKARKKENDTHRSI